MVRRVDLQEVELVDDDDDPVPAAPVPASWRAVARRVPRRWVVAGAVAVAVAAGLAVFLYQWLLS